jgi:AraC-like DNA-binding protein
MKNRSTFSFAMLRLLIAYCSGKGIDMRGFCRAKELDHDGPDDSARRVSADTFHAVWQEAAARSGDRDFGLHFGESVGHASGNHILFLVMMSCPDVRNALEVFCRYHNLMNDSVRPGISPCEEGVLLGWNVPGADFKAGRHEAEALLCILASVFRRVSGDACRPLKVTFRHARPRDISEHRRVFQAPLLFGQAIDAVVIAREHLSLPLNLADPGLLEVLKGYARTLLHRIYLPETWADRAKQAISKGMYGQRPTVKAVAKDLAVSPRSLQNKLKEEGMTFRELLDELRKETALSLLKDPEVTLYDVSFLLGFSEQSSFNHAFRRWTGASPNAYRRE